MAETGAPKDAVYDDEQFEKALDAILQLDKKDYPSYIGGMMVASGLSYEIFSPVDNSICFGKFQEPEVGATAMAGDWGVKAFEKWSKVPAADRVAIIKKARDLIATQKYRLAAAVLIGSGMTRKESYDEVETLLKTMDKACSDILKSGGKPVGAWAVITAHNSPLASPMGYASAIIAAGNTAVVMPSKHIPLPSYMVYDLFVKAGLPEGVLALIVDHRDQTLVELANDSNIAGVVASGSGKVMEDMMFLQVDDELAFVNEVKGMNPVLIHRPADMKKAVKDLLDSAFRYSGQKLYSTSKVIVTLDDQQKFLDALLDQIRELKITDPADPEAFSGPIINKKDAARFEEELKRVSHCVIYGGKRIHADITNGGYYYTPAVVMGIDDEDDLSYMDSGLPILCVKIADSLESAIEEMAYTEYGLSAGVYAKDTRIVTEIKESMEVAALFVNESSGTLKPCIRADVRNFLK